ncbi:hypothetical protein CK203_037209 [Vitis vinifera]|uniref:Uncharacterized protein n=1 Tax=Vitis vinifera TaxID=29760 RepID=A0A438HS54_VITVI|nr:hypothetical protein CK203_037209 [Vitis vinifera]
MTPEVVIRCPWSLSHPLRVIWIAGLGHSTPSSVLTQLLSDFSPSSGFLSICYKGPGSYVIHFHHRGRHGILGARHIAEALRIPMSQHVQRIIESDSPPERHSSYSSEGHPHATLGAEERSFARGIVQDIEGFFFGPHHLIMALFCTLKRRSIGRSCSSGCYSTSLPQIAMPDFGALGYQQSLSLSVNAFVRDIHSRQMDEYDSYGADQGAPLDQSIQRHTPESHNVEIPADINTCPYSASIEPIPEVAPSAPQPHHGLPCIGHFSEHPHSADDSSCAHQEQIMPSDPAYCHPEADSHHLGILRLLSTHSYHSEPYKPLLVTDYAS